MDNLELITAEEAAERLGLKPATLTNWRATGKGPRFTKIGRSIYYRPEAIRAFIDAAEHEPGRAA